MYIQSHGCKEDLVARPQDWPGVHCVTALLNGEPITGTWFDRTREWEARLRGEEFGARQFAETEVVNFAPLPCWRDLSAEQYRERIAELVEAIIAKAAAQRVATGIEPLGELRSCGSSRFLSRRKPGDHPPRSSTPPAREFGQK